ncbi:MAG: UDP-N-acetylmuramoyl-L-alanine--D-glutamate ligase [Hyphomicrobiales bacterium]
MIPVTHMHGKSVLVLGLGGSGLATAEALKAGGAKVLAFDDNEAQVLKARAVGIDCEDLRDVDFDGFEALVLSPGIPLTHPEPHWSVKKAHAAGVSIIGDVELFNRERLAVAPNCPFIAITGTNGKSTTTALLSHMLSVAGYDVQMGGNIGRAVLTLDPLATDKCYVVECSSYQIDLAPSLKPSIGVHLNISPDHIDRHGTVEHYADVKARLVVGADHAVVGVDDPLSIKIADQCDAKGVSLARVSLSGDAAVSARGSEIFNADTPVAKVAGITSLRGEHNLQNAAIAYAVCHKMGLDDGTIQKGLDSFGGLPHRLEQVAERDGVFFVNDSKATNADAAAKALASFDKIYWILGGLPKEGGIQSLNEFFPKIVHAFLIGEAAEAFGHTLTGIVPYSMSETLEVATRDAVAMSAARSVEANETVAVLLAPACASWDQFSSFEARGDAFKSSVKLELN